LHRAIRLITLAFFSGFLTLFAGAQSATIESLYSLNAATDGSTPYGNVVQGPDGNYYGTTAQGGVNGNGTVFRVTPKGVYTVLYAFQGSPDGQNPQANLYLASDGNFYGTTARGGANGGGTIFRVSSTGVFTLLYTFTNGTDGGFPSAGVIEGSDGNFYGTTVSGGAINAAGFTGYGTIFQMTPNGVLTTIYTFTGGDADGSSPYAGLVEGSDGFLYGTTNSDEVGDTGYYFGSVFKVSKTGAFKTLYHFGDGNDGGNPDGGLLEAQDGSFYGSTHNGGLFANDDDDTGQGVLYNITPSGVFKTMYEFTGQADSGRPEGTLTFGSDGNLYGTTTISPAGTLFQLTPSGGFVTLGQLGANPTESLGGPIVGSDGNFYGTTDNGGANTNGSIFEAIPSPALTPLVQLTLSSQTVTVGTPVKLSWQIANAFSTTMQRCVASMQNATPVGGTWAGLQTGTMTGAVYGGSVQVTPTASGAYTYALTCGGTITGFATLTVPPMTATTSSLPDGVAGVAYSQTLTEQNGLAPFTWTVTSGTLPAGLTLNASSGAITGTPTQPGVSSFTVQVTDSESVPATASASLSITVAASAPTVTVGASTLNISAPGATASMTLTVSGFAGNAFSFACSGLPAKSQCIFGTVTGSQAYGTTTLQVVTDGGLSAHVDPNAGRSGAGASGLVMAAAVPGVLALFGFARKCKKAMLSWLSMVLFALAMAGGLLTGCSGSSKTTTTTTTTGATPAGTSTVTVTATAGDQNATVNFTLQVQ
jgi:uncharacterized repeat protein (TIGR03803 family)